MPDQGPQHIRIQDFTYELPDARIARYPLAERDASKLLVYRNREIREDVYRHIDRYLDNGAMLVFNNTRVIPARLQFSKSTGSTIEIFCLEPEAEPASSMTQTREAVWKCMIGGAKKWKSGPLMLDGAGWQLQAERLVRGDESSTIRFSWTPADLSFAEILSLAGQVPLPPYLQRPPDPDDRERYQTVYARHDGSVAAPTAGLHFTEQVFQQLALKNVQSLYLTLHVGAGTFKPVKSETIGGHEMHAEFFDVSAEAVQRLLDQYGKGQIVAVGTTSLRTLESLFLMGSKLLRNPDLPLSDLSIRQWDAYDPAHADTRVPEALEALLRRMEHQQQDRMVAQTQLLIAPGYRIRMVDALVTNFHQPASTLLLLVAALVGTDWRAVYEYALGHDFRFLSYGDGSLLFRGEK